MEIWQTYRNADDIEGRGPMVPDRAFLHEHHAAEYIDAQPGIMGRRGEWSKQKYGDWEMKRVFVYEHSVIEQERQLAALKETALAKLTVAEKEALGL
jgi:hypothetical protein